MRRIGSRERLVAALRGSTACVRPLAGAAVTGAFVAAIAGSPQSAFAACSGLGTTNVLCDAANPSGGTLSTNSSADTVVNVNAGAGITTGGAGVAIFGNGDLTFNNNDPAGIARTNAVAPTQPAVDLEGGATGNVSYLGNGSIISNGAGLFASANGSLHITSNAAINAVGTGIAAQALGAGGAIVDGTGDVTVQQGSAINVFHNGTGPAAGTNGITITGSGNVQTNSGDAISAGIFTAANASNVLVDRNGSVAGFQGILAFTQGSGNVTIGGSGAVTATSGNGLAATSNSGNVLVNRSGAVTATDRGIQATATGAGNVTVAGAGNVSSTGQYGIQATSIGGNVLVDRAGTATSGGYAIYALTSGAGTATVNLSQDASGGQYGVYAQTANGLATVNVTGGTANGTNTAVYATSSGAGVTVNMTGGQIGTVASRAGAGIQAFSSGSAGDVTVASTSLFSNGAAIRAEISQPSSGNVAITANGAINTSGANSDAAIIGRILNNGSTGNVTVTQNAAITTAGIAGIQAMNLGSGATTITSNAAVTNTFGHGIFVSSNLNLADPSGTGPVTVTNNGAISAGPTNYGIYIFNAKNTVTNTGSISGSIGLIAGFTANAGTTTVTNSGTIAGTNFSVLLRGSHNLFTMDGPNAALVGQARGSGTDTFRLAGSGSNSFDIGLISNNGWAVLDKAGSSSWTLTGTGQSLPALMVNGGTLLVDGAIATAGGVTVNAGGTLGGHGTLPATTINAGGTLSPGNSIGTIAVSGNLTFVGAGNYLVEVSPTTADLTTVTQTAKLSGTLQAVGTGGVFTIGQRYTVLTASRVTGTFDALAISGNFGLTKPHIEYDARDVYLVLDPASLTSYLPGGTGNQRAVAGGIDNAVAAGNTAAPFAALFNLQPAQLPAALDQLSGEVHASTASVLADESLYVRSAILGRLRQASYGGESSMASLQAGGPQAFAANEELSSALAYAKSPLVTKAPIRSPQPTSEVVFWGQGFGARGSFNADGNAASVKRDLAGFITGVDTRVGTSGRAGLAAGYTASRNTLDGRGSADVESGHVAAYGGWSFGAVTLRAGGAYAFHTIDTDRTIAFPGFFDRATAHYGGDTGQIFGEFGYGIALANVAIEPFAGGAFVHVQTDSAAERGMLAALNTAGTTFEVGYSALGIRAASLIPLANSMLLVPRATLAWQHAFGNAAPDAVLAFQSAATSPFSISGVPVARDAALAEAGLDLAINSHATIGISYTGQIASAVQDHGLKGRFSWKF